MTPVRLFEKRKKKKKTDETSNVIHHFNFSEDKKNYTDDAEISKIYKNSCIRYDTFGF